MKSKFLRESIRNKTDVIVIFNSLILGKVFRLVRVGHFDKESFAH